MSRVLDRLSHAYYSVVDIDGLMITMSLFGHVNMNGLCDSFQKCHFLFHNCDLE